MGSESENPTKPSKVKKAGRARIYGTKTALFDGRDSKKYVARLAELEAKAKAEKRGGWRFTEGQ